MGWSRGTARYSYKVKIDLEDIVDKIIKQLPGDGDWELDGTEIVLDCEAECNDKTWYCRATLESPEEYEIELLDSVDDVDVDQIVLDVFRNIEKIPIECEIDQESIEDVTPEYEPDPDLEYEKWRDGDFESDD